MAITAASATYRVRIADAGATTVAGNVALTLGMSDITAIPVISGPSVDPLNCTTISHPFSIDCMVDTVLFTSSSRLEVIGRLCEIQRDTGGGFTTLATGRIKAASEVERGRVTLYVTDERWAERSSEIFRTTTSVQLHPPGLDSAWRELPAAGTATYTVAEVSGDAVKLTVIPDASKEGTAADYSARIPQSMLWSLLTDMVDKPSISASNSAGNFTSLRFRYSAVDRTVISFRESLSAAFFRPDSITGPLGPLSPKGGDGTLHFAWVYISGHALSPNDTITGRFYFPSGVAVSENVPVHIGGAAGIHPMDLLEDILDGTYGGDAVQYDSTAMTTLKAISMRPVWARIGAPAERSEWLEENLYKPYAVVPAVGTDLVARPTSLWAPIDEDPDTYTELDASGAQVPTWRHTSRDLVTVVRFTSRSVRNRAPAASTTDDWPIDDVELEPRRPLTIEHDNTATLGKRVHEIDTDLILDTTTFLNASQELADAIFNVFGDGPQSGEIAVPDDAGVQVGDNVSLDYDTLKAYNPQTGDRTGNRIVQLISFSESTPARTVFQYIDKGPHSQPLSAPTVSIAEATDLNYLEVTISGLAAGTTAVVEVETGSSTPSTYSLAKAGVGNETVSFFVGASSGNGYARARAVAPGRISSAWATDSVALTTRARVDSADVLRNSRAATVTWTIPASGTEGMRTDYDIHGRSEAPTFGSNQADYDADDLGFEITDTITTRDAVSVQLTPYTGWTGAAVSGSAGDAVVITRLFPRALPGTRGIPTVRQPSMEVTFNVDGEAVVSAVGDEDTTNIYVTVGNGSAPSDPTAAVNDGAITGSEGTVDTGVKITTGNDAYVKAVTRDASGRLNSVASAQFGRLIGPFHKDSSSRQVTGTTVETTLETITVPGGSLGSNGLVELIAIATFAGTTDTKTLRIDWGGTTEYTLTISASYSGDVLIRLFITNSASTSNQVLFGFAVYEDPDSGTETDVITASATLDSTSDQDIDITGQLANSADSITLAYTLAMFEGTN